MGGIDLEAVGVDDAARAMILAAEHGRVGERYLISEKLISNADVARIAAQEAGVAPPGRTIALPVAYALATIGTIKGALKGTDERLSLASLRLMRAEAGGPQQGRSRARLAAPAGGGIRTRSRPVLGRPTRGQAAGQSRAGGLNRHGCHFVSRV